MDPAHGGRDSVRELEDRHGPVPATVESVRGGGGRHLYSRHPGGQVPNRVGIQLGIDVRGDGGDVLAPPSLHPGGMHHFRVAGRSPQESALAFVPAHFCGQAAGVRPHARAWRAVRWGR